MHTYIEIPIWKDKSGDDIEFLYQTFEELTPPSVGERIILRPIDCDLILTVEERSFYFRKDDPHWYVITSAIHLSKLDKYNKNIIEELLECDWEFV
jgi:hypothetical protein